MAELQLYERTPKKADILNNPTVATPRSPAIFNITVPAKKKAIKGLKKDKATGIAILLLLLL